MSEGSNTDTSTVERMARRVTACARLRPGTARATPLHRSPLIRHASMRKWLSLFAVVIGTAQAVLWGEESLSRVRVPFERGSNSAPSISVFLDLGMSGFGRKHPESVIACIWPDGRVLWSRDHNEGGPPYLSGRIDPKRLAAFIADLDSRGIFTRKLWFDLAVDASHHDVHIIDGSRRVAIRTSRDYYIKSGNLPERIADVSDASSAFRKGLEELLPRQGQRLSDVEFEFRPL